MNRVFAALTSTLLVIITVPATGSSSAPFAVGSMTRFFHDESRPFDSVAGVNSGVRILLTEIWYPVDHEDIDAGSAHPTYGDYVFGDMDMHHRMMTKTVTPPLIKENVRDGVSQEQIDAAIDALFNEPRLSYLEAPLARIRGGFPVIFLSHGDGGTRYNMETVAIALASHGYIVIAPEHAGNASFAQTGRDPALRNDPQFAEKMKAALALHDEKGAYGAPENLGQSIPRNEGGQLTPQYLRVLDSLLMQRVNDLRAILDALPRLNEDGFFKGAMNLDQIGLMGRSLGGATTLAALGLEPRFKAGVAVVAPSVPDLRTSIPKEMLARDDEESVMFSSTPAFPLSQLSRPTFLLSSGEDKLIININMALAMAFEGVPPSSGNPHPELRRSFEVSEAPVVWGLFVNGNHGTLNVSGAYWWPHLKPDRLPSYFDPTELYPLAPAKLAHEIQAEKVRSFFDLTIKGDQSAQERLLDNPWEGQGFRLEARNLEKDDSSRREPQPSIRRPSP